MILQPVERVSSLSHLRAEKIFKNITLLLVRGAVDYSTVLLELDTVCTCSSSSWTSPQMSGTSAKYLPQHIHAFKEFQTPLESAVTEPTSLDYTSLG
jgi:hypothetical protein